MRKNTGVCACGKKVLCKGLCSSCYAKTPGYKSRQFKHKLKVKYGLSVEEYERLLEEQGGGCAICGGPQIGNAEKLAVDHGHDTGKVRGLLCTSCNTGLAVFKDDVALLRRAILYLRRAGY